MIKGVLRASYGEWAANLVVEHLKEGGAPSEFILPTSWPETKRQMMFWMVCAVREVQTNKQVKLRAVWQSTGLSRAWESGVKVEALSKAADLFKGAGDPDD